MRGPEADHRLARESRVRRRFEYRYAQNEGVRVHTAHFVVLVSLPAIPQPEGASREGPAPTRLGITITKRIAPRAVDRNRVKRLVRETFRTEKPRWPAGVDLVVLAKAGVLELDLAGVRRELTRAEPSLRSAAARAISRNTR